MNMSLPSPCISYLFSSGKWPLGTCEPLRFSIRHCDMLIFARRMNPSLWFWELLISHGRVHGTIVMITVQWICYIEWLNLTYTTTRTPPLPNSACNPHSPTPPLPSPESEPPSTKQLHQKKEHNKQQQNS